jgi:biopolymer transport protein ExbD
MGFKKRTKVSAEFNMSSLTDIVFLLLIFFMLTSSVVSPTAINLMLPNSSRSSNTSSPEPMKVRVDQDKVMKFNNLIVDLPSLKGLLGQAIQRDGRAVEEITVILEIHPEVDAQTLVSVVDIINTYGAKIIMATGLR